MRVKIISLTRYGMSDVSKVEFCALPYDGPEIGKIYDATFYTGSDAVCKDIWCLGYLIHPADYQIVEEDKKETNHGN